MGTLINFFKKHFLFFILIPIVIISQALLLEPHLKYGFSDVDWGFLSNYKMQNDPLLPTNFIKNFKEIGVYAHQIYYIGIQGIFFDLKYELFQFTTHIFKTIATLALYPSILLLSGNYLVAFISVILFAFSYPAVGTMYTVVTSSDYTAVISMAIFFWLYIYIIKNEKKNLIWLCMLTSIFILTLFLSTERMYPLVFFIILIELVVYSFNRFKRNLQNSFKRLSILLFPVFVGVMLNPASAGNFLSAHGPELVTRISSGEWHWALTPAITLGSTILPHNYWKYFGIVDITNLTNFIYFFINPLIIFSLTSLICGILIFPKPLRFFLENLFLIVMFSFITFIVGTHSVTHFDKVNVIPALIGFYLLSFSIASFRQWLINKDNLYIGLFISPILAYLYIILTWVAVETALIFIAPHRYLTVPGILISFFLGSLFVLIIRRIWRSNNLTKPFVFIPIILLLMFLNMSAKASYEFFDDQLRNGFGAADKNYMRGQLNSYLTNLNSKTPSLFYFDFIEDYDNGYYYDNTITAGFSTWMLWHRNINFNNKIAPDLFWNRLDILPTLLKEKAGRTGIEWNGKFYLLEDFYAFKLKDKKVINIKDKILQDLKLYE